MSYHTCVHVRVPPPITPAPVPELPPDLPPATSCNDQDPSCSGWAAIGQCTANPAFMLAKCSLSCGKCQKPAEPSPPPPAASCVDDSTYCPTWAKDGQCKSNPGYMSRACRLSCGACGSDLPSATTAGPSFGARIPNPPDVALGYSGHAWPDMSIPSTGDIHLLAIGDWGGMDGTVITDGKRAKKDYYRIIQYQGGDTEGPHTMARSRPGCEFANLVECFNTHGQPGGNAASPCYTTCGWAPGLDDKAQLLVAEQFKRRAAQVNPKLVLNVGDNFYWGGIETDCGTPMTELHPVTKHQFDSIFEGIYSGPGLDNVPWLSVLGNHDWGGRYFNAGWDQQIAYTWQSQRWLMPAPYWTLHVDFPDKGFSADFIMTDSNAHDAKDSSEDPEHNVCGALHTPSEASCAAQGGPPSVAECKTWFHNFWKTQQRWAEQRLSQSTADWQIMVTHFPCGHSASWYAKLHMQYGLDLLVTGHRHEQELWQESAMLGGLTCIVTGGGGGITSEMPPAWGVNHDSQYGFFDLTISKEKINILLINQNGDVVKTGSAHPS
ncbi:unnamed protein product [Polarella glacialis]|uniref:ShKT domain-containing protein n=1 Tax=Polarella glacialis TaxID=89957 RepID=A0A813EYQ3_POLGL|nr:unnamed protein product [Polarella glacialis]CAE8657773.1 unnamed protein product [Polarella glacialis]